MGSDQFTQLYKTDGQGGYINSSFGNYPEMVLVHRIPSYLFRGTPLERLVLAGFFIPQTWTNKVEGWMQ